MTNCKICGSQDTVLKRIGKTEIILCQHCEAAFAANIPSQQELTDYYESDYRITTQDYIATEKRRVFRFPEQSKLIAQLVQLKPPPASVLDIGCDKGYFLDEIRRYGYKVMGVEPSKAAREYCQQIGIATKKNEAELNETYDIITMWHTLEHISEPVEFLRRVNAQMNSGGIIAIRVPDYDCIWRKFFREKWIWFQPQNHYFHYTKAALHKLLTITGFENIQIQSQRPNNLLTRKAYQVASKTFQAYWQDRITLKKRFGRIYEDLTGIELFAVAVRK